VNRRALLWLPALGFLGIFFFYPLTRIFALSFRAEACTASSLRLAAKTLGFTLYQAGLSTLLTLMIGLPAAYLFAKYAFRGKTVLRALVAVPFMLPTVAVAAAFNALLGPNGWVNLALMRGLHLESPPIPFLHTLGAILLAHVFYNTVIVLRVVGYAWSHLDVRLEDSARLLGASRTEVFLRVTLPLLRPAIFAASLLVFLFDFTSFGVVLLLGGPSFATLEVEIYVQAMHYLNLPVAALLAVIQIFFTLGFSAWYSRMSARASVQIRPQSARRVRRARSFSERVFLAGMVSFLFALFIFPLAALPIRSVVRTDFSRGEPQIALTGRYYAALFVNERDSRFYVPPVQAAVNSLTYAGLTAIFSLALGFPVASLLAHPRRIDKILDPLVMLPLGASAVMLGLGFIVAFNHPPMKWLASRWIVPAAHTMVALPFVIRSLQPAFSAIPQSYRDAAATLGASPWQVWRRIDFPILSRGILAAASFAFTISLGEFGATSLLARPEYPTLPTAIYRFLSLPGALNYGQAMAMATLLMLLTLAGIVLIERTRISGTEGF
jgi:thiamine transport system permease protein